MIRHEMMMDRKGRFGLRWLFIQNEMFWIYICVVFAVVYALGGIGVLPGVIRVFWNWRTLIELGVFVASIGVSECFMYAIVSLGERWTVLAIPSQLAFLLKGVFAVFAVVAIAAMVAESVGHVWIVDACLLTGICLGVLFVSFQALCLIRNVLSASVRPFSLWGALMPSRCVLRVKGVVHAPLGGHDYLFGCGENGIFFARISFFDLARLTKRGMVYPLPEGPESLGITADNAAFIGETEYGYIWK